MTLTNFDSSLRTQRKSQKTLYTWNTNNKALVNLGRSVLQEQPSAQSGLVVIDRRRGACVCEQDTSANPYEFNGLSQCRGNY
jgi:hypothetical protein